MTAVAGFLLAGAQALPGLIGIEGAAVAVDALHQVWRIGGHAHQEAGVGMAAGVNRPAAVGMPVQHREFTEYRDALAGNIGNFINGISVAVGHHAQNAHATQIVIGIVDGVGTLKIELVFADEMNAVLGVSFTVDNGSGAEQAEGCAGFQAWVAGAHIGSFDGIGVIDAMNVGVGHHGASHDFMPVF